MNILLASSHIIPECLGHSLRGDIKVNPFDKIFCIFAGGGILLPVKNGEQIAGKRSGRSRYPFFAQKPACEQKKNGHSFKADDDSGSSFM